jgi:NAD dependent epimerase/dehydratase family enzyme
MVMSHDRGGIFSVLLRLARLGLGGSLAGGKQFVSWIHGKDFVRVIEFLIEHEEIVGPVNLASPHPLPQKDFMRAIRRAARIPIGLPAAKWMLELGAIFMRTDTELLLKSRRVIPSVLLDAGFEFRFSKWEDTAADLVKSV